MEKHIFLFLYLLCTSWLSAQNEDSIIVKKPAKKTMWYYSSGVGQPMMNGKFSVNSAIALFTKSGLGYSFEFSSYDSYSPFESSFIGASYDSRILNTSTLNLYHSFITPKKAFRLGGSVGFGLASFSGERSVLISNGTSSYVDYTYDEKTSLCLNFRMMAQFIAGRYFGLEAGITGNTNKYMNVMTFDFKFLLGRLRLKE